jgi:hypothetical protein
VNGSSHTILGPLWAAALGLLAPCAAPAADAAVGATGPPATWSSARLVGRQLSARGGTLEVGVVQCVRGDALDATASFVTIGGRVATVYEGSLLALTGKA